MLDIRYERVSGAPRYEAGKGGGSSGFGGLAERYASHRHNLHVDLYRKLTNEV